MTGKVHLVHLVILALILTLPVGCSRVDIGVHWPSDALAG